MADASVLLALLAAGALITLAVMQLLVSWLLLIPLVLGLLASLCGFLGLDGERASAAEFGLYLGLLTVVAVLFIAIVIVIVRTFLAGVFRLFE